MTSFKDWFDKYTCTQNEIDRFLDPKADMWAYFDTELGYLIRNSIQPDGMENCWRQQPDLAAHHRPGNCRHRGVRRTDSQGPRHLVQRRSPVAAGRRLSEYEGARRAVGAVGAWRRDWRVIGRCHDSGIVLGTRRYERQYGDNQRYCAANR